MLRRSTAALLAPLLALALSLLAAPAALAQITWDGGGDNATWSDPLNWSGNTLPGLTDHVVIPAAATSVTITTDVAVASLSLSRRLTLNTNRSLSITGSAALNAQVTLSGGARLTGGVWTINAGGGIAFPGRCLPAARLSNLTINGDIPNFNGYFRWNNVTLNGTLTAVAASEITFEGDQTLTGVIAADSSSALNLTPFSAGTLTIAPSAVVRGGAISFTRAGCQVTGSLAVINNGTINANLAGRAITFEPDVPLTNNGLVTAGPGSALLNSPVSNSASGVITSTAATINLTSLTNTGSITLTGGTANLAGTFNPNQLGNFTTTAATNITGTADLNGQTWNVPGPWRITGTLQNGAVNLVAGTLTFPARCNAAARLSDLVINGDIPNFNGFFRWNNVTLNGTLTAVAASEITFEGNQTLTGTIAASTSSSLILSPFSAGTLTIAPSAVVRGGAISFSRSGCQSSGALAVVNNGLINADLANRAIAFTADVPLTNNATVTAAPGTIDLSGGITNTAAGSISGNAANITLANLANAGVIALTGGTTTFAGTFNPIQIGNFTSTGTNVVSGTADLNGQTWNLPGAWRLTGTLQNGVVNLAAGTLTFPARCSPAARLSNLVISGNLPAFNGHIRWNNVTLNGTLTATGPSEIAFEGNQTLTGTLAADTTGTLLLTPFSAGTLTIAPSAVVRGGAISFSRSGCQTTGAFAVVNNGLINANLANRTIAFAADVPLTNNAAITAGPGTLQADGPVTNSASGVISASNASLTLANLANAGAITAVGGTLTLSGVINPTQLGNVASTATNTISGTADLNGQTWNVPGTWRLTGTLQNGAVNLAAGTLTFPARCNSPARLSNLIINGDLPAFNGFIRWNNVTLNGTLTAVAASEITFEGNQTLTGTLAADSASSLILSPFTAGTLTIAPSAVVRGGGIAFARVGCQSSGLLTVVNNGVINANLAGRTISFDSDTILTNSGLLAAGPGQITLAAPPANLNLVSGVLTGGAWRVAPGGTLRLPASAAVRTIGVGAAVTLDGPTANLFTGAGSASALAELTTIDGALDLLSGRGLTASPIGGTFTNNGSLTLGAGSLFTVNGNYIQTSAGALHARIDGPSAANVGTLAVTGSVSLAGAVSVQYANGYAPAGCTSASTIISAGAGVTGGFTSQELVVKQEPFASALSYLPGSVSFISAPRADIVGIGGTPPGDGLVTGDDFVAFINAFAAQDQIADVCGIGGPPSPRDGLITGDDFIAFINAFAGGCP